MNKSAKARMVKLYFFRFCTAFAILNFCTCFNVHLTKLDILIIESIVGQVANGEVNDDDSDGLMRKLRAL